MGQNTHWADLVPQSLKWTLGTLNWTLSLTLLAYATNDPGVDDPTLAWSVVAGLWGCVFLIWGLLTVERVRVERLVSLMAQAFEDERDVPSIRR